MTNYHIQLEKHVFVGKEPGPNLVIGARIHGDEPSGEIALRKIIRELQDGTLTLARGQLTLFPVLNSVAKELNLRGVWLDTNRDVTDHTKGETPEHAIRRAIVFELNAIEKQAKAQKQPWHLLDLHSVPLPGKAHTILSEGPDDLAFAKAVGADTIYTGWRKAYLRVDQHDLDALATTIATHRDFTKALIYASRDAGAQSAVCLESGQNDDPLSVQTAYIGIRNSLAFHKLTDEATLPFKVPETKQFIEFNQVLIRRDESEKLVGITSDAQPVSRGQVILSGATRELCVPPENKRWIIAHPIANAVVGRHFGFLANIV